MQSETITVSIYNSLGQSVIAPVVVNGKQGTNNVRIEMPADLPEGMYLMQIAAGTNVWTQSLVK